MYLVGLRALGLCVFAPVCRSGSVKTRRRSYRDLDEIGLRPGLR